MLEEILVMINNHYFWYGFLFGMIFEAVLNLFHALESLILDYGWRKRKDK